MFSTGVLISDDLMFNPIKKRSFVFIAGLLTTGICSLLGAESAESSEDETNDVELAPYVAVATRTPVPLDRLSPSVSYISEAEMIKNQARRLVDVLKRQPGIVLNTTGTKGAQTSLFMRGTNSNHTSFFLDGRRLNPAFSNQFDLEFLSVDNLSSVQIQRGPSSVNFGSAGIGGVVSLQTRSGLGEKTKSITVDAEYGSYDYTRSALNASFSDEKWALSIGVSDLSTETDRDNDNFDILNANSRIEYQLTERLVAELVSLITDTDKEVPGPVSAPSDTNFNQTQSWLISPGLRFEDEDWYGRIFYSRSKQFLEGVGTFSDPKNSVLSDEVYAQVDYSGLESLLLSTGVLYRNDEIDNQPLSFFENFGHVGIWTQIQWQILNEFELRLGGRYDEYTDFDSSTDGNIELIYLLPEFGTSLFAKLATAYSPPSSLSLAFDGDPIGTALNPEESVSYEIGLKQSLLSDTIQFSTVLFRNEIDELVTFVGSDAVNIDRATTEGVEIDAKYSPLSDLSIGLSYTYLVALNDETDERLVRRPRHLLQLSADYQITDAWFAGLQGIGYFDRKDIDASFNTVDHEDFFVVNLITDYKLDERITLFARIENLLDEDYESVLGYPALGLAGYIGARLSF